MNSSISLYKELTSFLGLGDAINIILVIESARPATYVIVFSQDNYQHLVKLIKSIDQIKFINRHGMSSGTFHFLVYDKSLFTDEEVLILSSTDEGMGKLLGYICGADEMGKHHQYTIEYYVNNQQLYAQSCAFITEERKQLAHKQLERYQEIGDRLGIKFRLFIGKRSTLSKSWVFYMNNPEVLWERREEISKELEPNFKRTTNYFKGQDYDQWKKNYDQYHKLWGSIGVINTEMSDINPRLEVNLYRSWNLSNKVRSQKK